MKFGKAIELMKQGYKLKRENWNGKNQFVFLVTSKNLFRAFTCKLSCEDDEEVDKDMACQLLMHVRDVDFSDVLAIKTTSNQVQLGWLASQTDMLSDDWEIVEDY
ncbi:hypothetical protein CPR19088_GLDEOEPO_01355 [Companilactobacillus paralimentarius]